jgi:hypothetical protein
MLPDITLAQGLMDSLNESAQNLVFNIVMGIMGMFVWLSALLLNFAVNSFVIGFGDAFANTGIGVAVDNTWVIVRDFVNLTFIFGFVYIGFKMILSSSDSNTRRWLVNIILAALLVNFSLFMVKFAVDMSNQLAAQIAVNALGSTSDEVVNGLPQIDIASEFMARLGLSKVFSLNWEDINGAGWGYIFGSALLSLTAMFVFAAGGLLLIMRFAVLCFFMVLSPVMFIGWILPPLKDTFERFWSMFIGRALFAPLYLLFIYFSLQIISGLQVSIGGGTNGFGDPDWAGTFQGAGSVENGAAVGQLGTFPFFILAIVFMAGSLWIANKLGVEGGSKAVSQGKSFANKTRAFALRNTAGYGAMGLNRISGAALDKYNRADAAMSKTAAGRFTRGAIAAASLGALTDKNVQSALKAGKGVKVAGSETYDDYTRRMQEIQKRQNTENKIAERESKFKTNTAIYRDVDGVMSEDAKKDARAKLAAIVRDMSDDELKNLNLEDLTAAEVSTHLSDTQIKTLADSGNFSNDDIKKIRDARDVSTFSEFENVLEKDTASADELGKTFDELAKTVKGFSDERLGGLGARRLTDRRVAAHLSDSQLEAIQKSGKYTAKEFQQIKEARKDGILNLMGAGNGNIRSDDTLDTEKNEPHKPFIGSTDPVVLADTQKTRTQKIFERSAQDVGKLPVDIFTEYASREFITPQMIEQRMRNGDVSNEQLKAIKTNVYGHIGTIAINDPTRATKLEKTWETWANRSTYGAQFDSISIS